MEDKPNQKDKVKGQSRRSFIGASAGLAISSLLPSQLQACAPSTSIKVSEEDNFRAYVRLMGSLEPTTIYTWFSGHLWGIRPREAPMPLTTFQGLAKSLWDLEEDGTLTKKSYDIGFFGDLETGDVLTEFVNPYTKKTVRPFHFMYGGGGITKYKDGMLISNGNSKPIETPWVAAGGQTWLDDASSASFTNPFTPKEWPLASVGEQLHFGSSSTYMAATDDLFDSNKSTIPYTMFWTAINSWEPWLLMGDMPGFVMWRASGRKLFNKKDIPTKMRAYIKEKQPNYLNEGPSWEGRRSTYTSYKETRTPEKG